MKILERSSFPVLFQVLMKNGFVILGPTLQDGAIVYEEIHSVEDLPAGWTEEQDAGKYRLKRRADDRLFGFAVGPNSWKKFLHVPIQRLWKTSQNGNSFVMEPEFIEERKVAFLGVRPCDLHAIAIQDTVLLRGPYTDSYYSIRRKNVFVIAVNCTHPSGTCFCESMKTGPKATSGFDLALTELLQEDRHFFTAEAGTEQGKQLLQEISQIEANDLEKQQALEVVENSSKQMKRSLDTKNLKELLYRNYSNARWEQVASRCLNCANCTMVCPTCFCTTVEDQTDLSGTHAERWQKWDSCFHLQFSYIHGGMVRNSAKSRYRQWMTHKLATWQDQFGTSGCVGCGRCITWCPVGIDITEETAAIRRTDNQGVKK